MKEIHNEIKNILIGEISQRTGVNSITLRSWEKRYNLLEPGRTEKGHRLYSANDILRVEKIIALNQTGIAISQIKDVLADNLYSTKIHASSLDERFKQYTQKLFEAINAYDMAGLDEIYNHVLSLYPINITTQKIIIPLLKELGNAWHSDKSMIAEEHFFSIYLRNKIGARLHHEMRASHRNKLIFACMPNEFHEFGLLFFALYCLEQGFYPVILGANLPIEQLTKVTNKTKAKAIVLKGHFTKSIEQKLMLEQTQLNIPIFIQSQEQQLERENIHFLPADFSIAIKYIKKNLRLSGEV